MALADIQPPEDEYIIDEPKAIAVISKDDVKDTAHGSYVDKRTVNPSEESATASKIVSTLSGVSTKSVEFSERMALVENYGSDAVARSSESSNRILERSTTSMSGAKKKGNSTQIEVANTLGDLRNLVDDLAPDAAELSPVKRMLSFLPGNKKMVQWSRKFDSSQDQLNGIIKGLENGKESLKRDVADLRVEKKRAWQSLQDLAKAERIVAELDRQVTSEIESLKSQGKDQESREMESDILFPVRQRQQDLLTQIAVTVQGYLSMGLIEKNNLELIKGVVRAQSTTMTALRTAVITAEALAGQKIVLDKIDSVNETTNNLIQNNAEMLKTQTEHIHRQASSSGISLATLEKSFKAIQDTTMAIENFQIQANDAMAQTSESLRNHIEETKPFVERARNRELSNDGSSAGQISR